MIFIYCCFYGWFASSCSWEVSVETGCLALDGAQLAVGLLLLDTILVHAEAMLGVVALHGEEVSLRVALGEPLALPHHHGDLALDLHRLALGHLAAFSLGLLLDARAEAEGALGRLADQTLITRRLGRHAEHGAGLA